MATPPSPLQVQIGLDACTYKFPWVAAKLNKRSTRKCLWRTGPRLTENAFCLSLARHHGNSSANCGGDVRSTSAKVRTLRKGSKVNEFTRCVFFSVIFTASGCLPLGCFGEHIRLPRSFLAWPAAYAQVAARATQGLGSEVFSQSLSIAVTQLIR